MSRDWSGKGAKGRPKGILWGLVLAAAMMGAPQHTWAQAGSPLVEQANLRITLRVYNYGISHRLLSRAEDEATAILHQAGLEVAWVDCPLRVTERENYPLCQAPPSKADFAVKILTAGDAERFSARHEALGQALECSQKQTECSAYIFYRGVLELARDGGAAEYQLLGHALAHEIGHLLLGPNSHTPDGVMRAHWGQQELQIIARARLAFSEQQSERIREEVRERNAIEQGQLGTAQPR